jgi:hypothetical protein
VSAERNRDRSGDFADRSVSGAEAEFWAVPGVDRPAGPGGFTPGSRTVGSFEPVSTALVEGCAELVAGSTDVGELAAVAGLAMSRMAEVLPSALAAEAGVLDQIVGLLKVQNMVAAALGQVVGFADRAQVCEQATRTRLTTWLMVKGLLTSRQASGLVLSAKDVGGFALVRAAGMAGAINQAQTGAITDVLRHLPGVLDQSQLDAAELELVRRADQCAADGLARSAEAVLEKVAPELAQQIEEDKAARQLERANRKRGLTITSHSDGVATISGLLPVAEGELLRMVVDQVAEKRRRELADAPGAVVATRAAARADALVEIARHAQGCAKAAHLGGSGAKLVITIAAADLAAGDTAQGRLVATGGRLAVPDFAVLACDADVMRVVMGAKGEILDIGRATRAVPKGMRAALNVRDAGCSFPGCGRPVEVCHAHHIKPWHAGGKTSMSNLCLLCPTHHRMVEPPKGRPPDWVVKPRADGRVEFIPPKWIDPGQKPMAHHRYQH